MFTVFQSPHSSTTKRGGVGGGGVFFFSGSVRSSSRQRTKQQHNQLKLKQCVSLFREAVAEGGLSMIDSAPSVIFLRPEWWLVACGKVT